MRLAVVINSIGVGGAEKVLIRLVYHWCRQNHQVFLITFIKEKNFYKLESHENLHIIHFNETAILKSKNIINIIKFIFNSIVRVYKLQKTIKSLKPDLIVTFMIASNILGVLANVLCKIPIIIAERADPANFAIPKFYKFLAKILYPYANRLIVQSTHIADHFIKQISKHKIFIIPNFVRKPEVSKSSLLALNNNLLNNKSKSVISIKNIISVGRLDQFKDHKTLIYAFSKIANINPDLTVTIYGEGILRNQLQNLIKSLNLEQRIFLSGIDLNIDQRLLDADLFVFPSISEGFPNALCEAMSYGLPVIAADCPGNMNIVTQELDGLLFKCSDAEELSKCMLRLINDNELRSKLSSNAKNIVDRFDEQEILKHWDEMLELAYKNT